VCGAAVRGGVALRLGAEAERTMSSTIAHRLLWTCRVAQQCHTSWGSWFWLLVEIAPQTRSLHGKGAHPVGSACSASSWGPCVLGLPPRCQGVQ
jgi:hypothetical protein